VKAFTFSDVLGLLRRSLSSVPKWPYILVAVVLLGLGQWIDSIGGLKALRHLTDQIVDDLGVIQPFSLIKTYYLAIAACDPIMMYAGEHITCSAFRFLDPRRYVGALITTMGEVWSASGTPGRIILPIALVGSFPVAMSIVFSALKSTFGFRQVNPLHLVLGALVSPFIASAFALILQALAIVLFFVFGAVLGLVVWVVGSLGSIWSVWKLARDLEQTTKDVRPAAQTAAAVASPTDRPMDGGKRS
jgi:hypothetical protein